MKSDGAKNSQTMGLIGSGGQAKAHYRFMTSVMPIKKVKVYSPNAEHRKAFVAEMEKRPASPANRWRVRRAARGSDVICSATNSSRPVVKLDWLEAGMHYNSIREFETDLDVLNRCDVIAIHTRFGGIQHYQPPGIDDDMPGVRREKPRDWSKYPELCDLIAGKAPSRTERQADYFFPKQRWHRRSVRRHGLLRLQGAKEKIWATRSQRMVHAGYQTVTWIC
jgi:ornithine cyclodeaminase/alanine dehydrogenase-like protein (mu-crystallin family)